jgi:hypothetical protein
MHGVEICQKWYWPQKAVGPFVCIAKRWISRDKSPRVYGSPGWMSLPFGVLRDVSWMNLNRDHWDISPSYVWDLEVDPCQRYDFEGQDEWRSI